MVDPSVGAIMGGEADLICVRDHAGDASALAKYMVSKRASAGIG